MATMIPGTIVARQISNKNSALGWRLIILSVEKVSRATVMLQTEKQNQENVEIAVKWIIPPGEINRLSYVIESVWSI
jgi:hypothetical protein